jgi:hypothetical protein
MFWSRNASIERKLTFIMMATSLLGLSLACLCFEIYERASYREAITSELTALSQTLGANDKHGDWISCPARVMRRSRLG